MFVRKFASLLITIASLQTSGVLYAQGLEKIDLLGKVDRNPRVEYEYFISEKIKPVGQIIASWRQADYLSNDDVVYLKTNSPVSPGDRFSIYKDIDAVKAPKSFFGSSKGRRIQVIGALKVTAVKEEVVEAKIYNATHDINRGNHLMPLIDRVVTIDPQEPSKMVRGTILGPAEPTNLTGTFLFSFIDKGTRDGLKQNDLLYVYRKGFSAPGVTAKLPEVNIASLVVVNASENFSTVYNLTSIDAFEGGDKFKSAMTEVKYLDSEKAPAAQSQSSSPEIPTLE